MKTLKYKIISLALFIGLLTSVGHAEELVITSFDQAGTLEWNSNLTNGFYQVQWASTLDGKWHTDFPYNNIENTNETMSVQVPRFFRVIWKEGYSIEGIVYYSTSVLTNETVRLDPRSDDESPEQSTVTDLSGKFRFDGVKNGEYVIWTTSHDGFNGVGRFINVDGSNRTQDLRAYKRVSYLSPVRDSVITTNVVTFTWETVAEASLHTIWLRTGNNDNYGSKFLTITDLETNAYQTSLTLTNGLYSWGVDLYDSEGNKVAFGNDFDFVYSIEE